MNRAEGASFTICPHLSPALDPATCPLRRCASPSPLPGAHAGDLPSPTTGCPTILPRCQIDRYPILLRYSSRASADLRGRQPSLSAAHPTRRCSLAMVYHSSFTDDDGITKACGCPLLPLKTHIKGPAPASDSDKADIVDEAITFFRANVFFKNFHVKSPADKLLIYLTSYINIALKRLEGCRTLAVGTKAIINLGLEKVPVPGEPGFPFPGLFALPQSQEEAELLRNYLKQIREETSGRLLNCAYRTNGTPNKWWLAFAKRKFMNIVIL